MMNKAREDFKIGDTVYFQYVYQNSISFKDRRWNDGEVIGETSRSWLLRYWPNKLPKNGKGIRFGTPEQVKEDTWDESNREKILECIKFKIDTDVLRKVAELISYEPKP